MGEFSIERRTTFCRLWTDERDFSGSIQHTDDGVEIVLDSTPFYAEGGGELSDHGQIVGDNFVMRVTDVQRLNGIVHHIGELESGTLDLTGESKVKAHVDLARRAEKRVHHTATHLLHAALQTVLGSGVQQKGSVVATNRLRFDFSHGQPMTQSELSQVEQWVNAEIRANRSLEILEDVSIEDAKAQGVTALFGEKYGDAVRTVRTGRIRMSYVEAIMYPVLVRLVTS